MWLKNVAEVSKRPLVLALLGCLAGCGGGGSVNTDTDTQSVDLTAPSSDWVMVWNDEFDGDVINTRKWTYEVDCAGGGNTEQQCYTDSPENSYVSDGTLKIVALPAVDAEKDYTSARMVTKNKGDWTYGRFEARIKMPEGQGSWPAFWMLPTDSVYGGWPNSGEIDIVEAVNLKVANDDGSLQSDIYGTLHYGNDSPDNVHSGKSYTFAQDQNPADDFHTYAIEWQEGEIRWYVDGYLYATQRQSDLVTRSNGDLYLNHRGWFAPYLDQDTGELTNHWDSAPFDQDFHILLNLAVGGDWPESVNDTGVDAAAFANGQTMEVDYVRVYQCQANLETGSGCETVRAGYLDSEDDSETGALVEGKAPDPINISNVAVADLTLFGDGVNEGWPLWDCCGGSTPEVVDDADRGSVAQFAIGATPTVMGFLGRDSGNSYDASSKLAAGTIEFDMKIVTAPNAGDVSWHLKIESDNKATAVDFQLSESIEGLAPVAGEWQHYTFDLQTFVDAGLDPSAIDVVMVFPAWGSGEGAVYQIDDFVIGDGTGNESPALVLYDSGINAAWAPWDCCAGSTPVEVVDDAEHYLSVEFSIGATETVMGFLGKDTGDSFDASGITTNGVVQFDMKVMSMPNVSDADWSFKIESNNTVEEVKLLLSDSLEGVAPSAGEWQTYTFALQDLVDAGLDPSGIDVVMVFPAWGSGEGAVYRIDHAKIYDPTASPELVLFEAGANPGWAPWDCCAGSTPVETVDDALHNNTVEFSIGATETVMGFNGKVSGNTFDASSITTEGIVQFDMNVISMPLVSDAEWLFKIESNDAETVIQLPLSSSVEGVNPTAGEWQTYTFALQDLVDAGLDPSAIDVVMVFPTWGSGEGAVYRIDNARIGNPRKPSNLVLFSAGENVFWPLWDCCGGSTPAVVDDGANGATAEFSIGADPTVMGFLGKGTGSIFDASAIQDEGVIKFDMKVVSMPNTADAAWLFKVESNDSETVVQLDLSNSVEGVVPAVGEWQTYTFPLQQLADEGLDTSAIDVIMVFPAWGSGEGAVYRIDNAVIE